MAVFLVEPSSVYQQAYTEMIEEWQQTGEQLVPFVLRYDHTDFNQLLKQLDNLKKRIGLKENTVSSSTYWVLNADQVLIGAVNIRHRLNEGLLRIGGHIGYGIRPSMRKKGYATETLKQALLKAKEMNLTRVLLTCDKTNIGSAKVILNNGGILDSEEMIDGIVRLRYWIDIPS